MESSKVRRYVRTGLPPTRTSIASRRFRSKKDRMVDALESV
jgi:hypothetical protein